jgi:hypothetical protein
MKEKQKLVENLQGKDSMILKNREVDDNNNEKLNLIWKRYVDNDNESTNMTLLLELMSKEVDTQYKRKDNVENRSGFVIALLGVITCSLIPRISFGVSIMCSIICCISLILGCGAMVLALLSIWSRISERVSFEDIEVLNAAVNNEKESMIMLWQSYTVVLKRNDSVIKRKSRLFNKAIVLSMLYIVCYSMLLIVW